MTSELPDVTDSGDFLIILSSDSRRNWLNDTIINCAQNILRQQFHPPGLYDTSRSARLWRAYLLWRILRQACSRASAAHAIELAAKEKCHLLKLES